MKEHFASEEKPFHFTDSGLDNVYLIGIKYYEREDGSLSAEIPAVKQLMRLIASDLLYSSTPLRGQEIRFLRKRLGMKSTAFAQSVRIELETLSRIENEKQSVSEQVDALVRMYYLLSCDDPDLKEDAHRLKQLLKEELNRHNQKKIVLAMTANQEWEDFQRAA